MLNIYEALVLLVREHWNNHHNAYPQRIELSASDLQSFHAERKLVIETMSFGFLPDWQEHFLDIPVRQADVSALIDVNGQAIPVILTDPSAAAE